MNLTGKGTGLRPKDSQLYQEQTMFFKPFKFIEPTQQLNLHVIDNLDVDRIFYTGDIRSAYSALKNFVSAKIDKTVVEAMNYNQYNKLFRLSQLAIEHYTHQQQTKQERAHAVYEKFQGVQERSRKLDELLAQHEKKREDLREKIEHCTETIARLKEDVSKTGLYKCIYCNKSFAQREPLNSHVKRRHQDMLDEIKATNDLFRDENPLMKVKRLEEERKKLQEQIHMKQMQQLQKIHEHKVNEEQMVRRLAENLQHDLNKKIQKAFTEQIDQEHEEELNRRDEQNKKVIMGHVQDMNNMFGRFQDIFQDFQKKQSEMSAAQFTHQQQLLEIAKQQEMFKDETKFNEKKLEEENKKTQVAFGEIKRQNTTALVRNYMDNLTNLATSDQFLRESGVLPVERKKKEKTTNQQNVANN